MEGAGKAVAEPPAASAAGEDTTQTRFEQDFTRLVQRHFGDLIGKGMDANEACALSLKIAAGMAEPPLPVESVRQSIASASAPSATSQAYDDAASKVFRLFSSPESLHAAFWSEPAPATPGAASGTEEGGGKQGPCSTSDSSIVAAANGRLVTEGASASEPSRMDVAALQAMYSSIMQLQSQRVLKALCGAIEKLISNVAATSEASNPGFMRQLRVVLEAPLLEDTDYGPLTARVAGLLVGLQPEQRARVVDMLSRYNKAELGRLVMVLQQYITITLYQQQAITQGVENATRALGLLHEANNVSGAVAFSEFYNDAVNNEDFNIKEDFRRWKSPFKADFSFCNHCYVYDPASKARILQMENQMAQFNELQGALFRGLFGSNNAADVCPFLVLKVRRGPYLVQDTLVQINRAKETDSLKKPLKVKFVGEEGVDEGGVQKEFFQLLVRELFNPDYGMFTYDDRTRLNWFRPSHIEMDVEFELVGILIGLAIYNSHILEFSFPQVLYKKLMGQQPAFDDLKELHPDVHTNLGKLLTHTGSDVEDFGLFFQVDLEVGFGEIEQVDLIPGGSTTPVTNANRAEYVRLYTQHLLTTSIERQFAHFLKGFLRLCNGTALGWFRPEELELLVCGGQELDLVALEQHTLYDDGYTNSSQVVRWFWEVVHELGDAQKKRLLAFVTGSDRVPIKGLAHLNPPFIISRMGGENDRLPTAHTCFNHLLLPQYSSKQSLKQKLEVAIENAEGFGLM